LNTETIGLNQAYKHEGKGVKNMAQGTSEWETAIAEVQGEEVIIRGYKLSELVGNISYAEMIFLIFTGQLPSEGKRQLLDALFVSLAEHGISPSTVITRMLTSCGTPIQAVIAGSTLSIADWHGGACEQLAKLLFETVACSRESEEVLREQLSKTVTEYRAKKQFFEGFGHPQHKGGDPRARQLLKLADELKVSAIYTDVFRMLGEELSTQMGRPMHPNINGALACLLLDLGFPWRSVRGFVIASRTMGITAHYVEELEQGGRWRHPSGENVKYTGPVGKTLK